MARWRLLSMTVATLVTGALAVAPTAPAEAFPPAHGPGAGGRSPVVRTNAG